MPQTLLALLALMLTTAMSFSHQRATIHTYDRYIDDEMEVMASGLAMHVMEMTGAKAFDERTKPINWNSQGEPSGSSEFTSTGDFGEAGGCDLDQPYLNLSGCDDIDDVHMDEGAWQMLPFMLKDGQTMEMEVNVQVFYVDDMDLDTILIGTKSDHKKVIVTVRSPRHVENNRYTGGFVELERIFSYNVAREENRAGS